jgi:hypothetical protein
LLSSPQRLPYLRRRRTRRAPGRARSGGRSASKHRRRRCCAEPAGRGKGEQALGGRECRFRVIQWRGPVPVRGFSAMRQPLSGDQTAALGGTRQSCLYLAVRVRFAAGARTPAGLLAPSSRSAPECRTATSGAAAGAPLRLEPETDVAGFAFAPALARAAPAGLIAASAEPAPAAASDDASLEAAAPVERAEI